MCISILDEHLIFSFLQILNVNQERSLIAHRLDQTLFLVKNQHFGRFRSRQGNADTRTVRIESNTALLQFMLIVDRQGNLDTLEVQVELRKELYSDEMGTLLGLKKKLADRLKSVLSISANVKLMEPNSIPRSEGKSKHVIDYRKLK